MEDFVNPQCRRDHVMCDAARMDHDPPTPFVDASSTVRAHELGVEPDSAMARIAPWVRRTPIVESGPGSLGLQQSVVMKLECLQHSGSFKARGSFNSALALEVPDAGLIAASGGNHGLAVAFVARALGVPAEIFVPEASSAVKVDGIRRLGATVNVVGALYDDARLACVERAAASGALDIHPYDAPLTVSGQATVGVEILHQVPDLDTVIVAVGGGGLVAGITAALPDRVRIIGVEPTGSSCLMSACNSGGPVDVEIRSVAADSLGAKRLGSIPWSIIAGRVEPVVVPDEAIVRARQLLWDDVGIVVEHGGATAMAALTSGRYQPRPDEKVVVVVCGSNTDPSDLVRRT